MDFTLRMFFYLFGGIGIVMFTIGNMKDDEKLFRLGVGVFLCSVSLYMIETLP